MTQNETKSLLGTNGSRADREAKIEAYCEPRIAEMAEMSVGGIKTRSSYYEKK